MEMVVGGHSVFRRWVTTAVAMFSAAAMVQFRPRLFCFVTLLFLSTVSPSFGILDHHLQTVTDRQHQTIQQRTEKTN
ncbi:hypothetical protein Hanom_Chr03g00242081 [Helianthus anomalus]